MKKQTKTPRTHLRKNPQSLQSVRLVEIITAQDELRNLRTIRILCLADQITNAISCPGFQLSLKHAGKQNGHDNLSEAQTPNLHCLLCHWAETSLAFCDILRPLVAVRKSELQSSEISVSLSPQHALLLSLMTTVKLPMHGKAGDIL